VKTIRITTLILFLLIVLPITNSSSVGSNHSQRTSLDYNVKKELTQINYQIYINELDDFIEYGFPGNGSEQNPFIIENYEIRDLDVHGITIYNVDQYFIIRNCVLVNSRGMYISGVASGRAVITDNFCSTNTEKDRGIHILHSPQTVINNNTCEKFLQGIDIDDSNNCIISNNTCRYNIHAGIAVDSQSFDCVFENNTFQNNEINGLQFWMCPRSILINNKFYDDGLYIRGDSAIFMSYIIENNTVNGLKLGFFKGISSEIYSTSEYGQIFVVECFNLTISNQIISNIVSGITILSSNKIILKNNQITGIDIDGISIEDSPNCVINSNTFLDDSVAIGTYGCYNISITDNILINTGFLLGESFTDNYLSYTLLNNSINGKNFGFFFRISDITISNNNYGQIFLVECWNVKIENLSIFHTSYGIFLFSCQNCKIIGNILNSNDMYGLVVYYSENTEVDRNNCSDNVSGILAIYSGNTKIINNNCQNNVHYGIDANLSPSITVKNNTCDWNGYITTSLDESINAAGISVLDCLTSLIEDNICRNNKEYGVYCSRSDDVQVKNNTCNENQVGMRIRSYENVIVEKNRIYSNSLDGLYLSDSTLVLIYDNNITGNYIGIRLKDSSYCILTLNLLVNNYDVGVKLESTESCVIYYNNFKNNSMYGLCLDLNSDDSIIYENDFLLNNPDGTGNYASQGYDDGYNNTWYNIDSQKGNYWGKHEDLYSISGASGSYDLYPLDESIYPENRPLITDESNYISFIAVIALFTIILFRKRKKSL